MVAPEGVLPEPRALLRVPGPAGFREYCAPRPARRLCPLCARLFVLQTLSRHPGPASVPGTVSLVGNKTEKIRCLSGAFFPVREHLFIASSFSVSMN